MNTPQVWTSVDHRISMTTPSVWTSVVRPHSVTCYCIEHDRAVLHSVRQGSDRVQRGGIGDEPEAGHTAIGWLEAYDAAEVGGLTNAAPCNQRTRAE